MKNPVKVIILVTVPAALLAPVAYLSVTSLYPHGRGGGRAAPKPGSPGAAMPSPLPTGTAGSPLMVNGEPFVVDSIPIVPTSAWNGLRN